MTRYAVIAARMTAVGLLIAGAAAGVVYRAAPVDALRDTLAHRPVGASTIRIAGLRSDGLVALDALPEHFLIALLFGEDKRFFDHHGFDLHEIGVSLREWAAGARDLRGASTVTQQLARTVFLSSERTLGRKLREGLLTVKLERTLSKDEILELYVNTVEWGPDVYGIAEAAAHYFQRRPDELEPAQSAFLVAILPSPARLSAAFTKRRDTPLRVRRVLAALSRAANAAAVPQDGAAGDPIVRLVSAVRQAQARTVARRAAS